MRWQIIYNKPTAKNMTSQKTIAIIGAGASGLMCADYLCQFDVNIHVYEQLPTAGRKILWAGKTGLNISHNEPLDDFINRYSHSWLGDFVKLYDATWLQNWAKNLGIDTFVGSSGRIFPTMMKASPLLRAWLKALEQDGVQFFYRHKCVNLDKNTLTFQHKNQSFNQNFDAIILACGGLSYPKLGSTGEWQNWLGADNIEPMYASNVGICRDWSKFIEPFFGQALKRVNAWVKNEEQKYQGDIIITKYGFESGLIYKFNRDLRDNFYTNENKIMCLHLDLLPGISYDKILQIFSKNKKLSLNTRLQKLGLDKAKIAILRECTAKSDWQDDKKIAQFIKYLTVEFNDFRPINEAISSGGGVKSSAFVNHFQLKTNLSVFCTGEMMDWDAPTGGYLLTACFALGRGCGESVVNKLHLNKKTSAM